MSTSLKQVELGTAGWTTLVLIAGVVGELRVFLKPSHPLKPRDLGLAGSGVELTASVNSEESPLSSLSGAYGS